MGKFINYETRRRLDHAHEDQEEVVISTKDIDSSDLTWNVFIFFNMQAAFSLGHAMLGLGKINDPIESFSYYRPGNKPVAPGYVACLLESMTFQDIIDASGWIKQGVPGDYWNEHLDSCIAMQCSEKQGQMMLDFAHDTVENPGTYNLVSNNCLHFIQDALAKVNIVLTTKSGKQIHTIIPNAIFDDVVGVKGAKRYGKWKYWFPISEPPHNGLRTITDLPY